MADRGANEHSLPDDWPADPDPILALNRIGSFDWDLASGLMAMDGQALAVFDMRPDEYDDNPETLSPRIPREEGRRLDEIVAEALKEGAENYGAYFRMRLRDGALRWTHTQGYIRRDEEGRPVRIVGLIRDATQELNDTTARSRRIDRRRREAGIVQSTTDALAGARTLGDVVEVLQDPLALERLGAVGIALGLLEGGRVRLRAAGPALRFVSEAVPIRLDEPFPITETIRTLTPRFIESRAEFDRRYPDITGHLWRSGIRSAAYLPLIAQGRAVGALAVLYGDDTRFGERARTLLIGLGSAIAQSVQRALFYEQEKDLAEGLQQAMLPRTIPAVPGAQIAVRYRSARAGRDVGGDWYDVIPLPGGHTGLVIGDVQGHDTHAAAVMGQLRIVLRAYAAEGHPPATVMARASAFLRELDTDRFVTCLYADADLTTGVLQVVRAGHLDPLVRAADGTCTRVPVPGGMPLGLSAEFGEAQYPVATVELDPGNTLILCTDGLVERPGDDLDDGFRALARLVREGPAEPDALADVLCADVDRRDGQDDVAILLMRRRAGATPAAGGRLRQHVAPEDPEALAGARHLIRAAVRSWGSGERADEIELAADEMITNALMHTEGSAVVTLRVLTGTDRRLRVEVEDTSSALPRRREAAEDGVSGRGLLLVDRLADGWGVEARGTGKSVWCEFVVPPGPATAGRGPYEERPGGG
ncbi:SpoIIE family protein phosphatase [Streptomyces diastaticus]|uniref:protein-serine/threonine phosphatase n=2 Tax=Streptomyces TaxID=1883 RepID=A0A380N905_STRGR|nr:MULTISPECIES: SpoIIE family protein phosphatase [Streptomyces]QNE80068.1 SpoIIE family protein phosphatase [Streptomyces rutgersensis]WSU38975.1 SpoIIE family protein phosphatase [Streptomyces gougerotii]GFH67045.1 magnesium or manganese-dependent protein phosphatase [Streptomyces rutgersensis]SUP35139.1 regulatory protein [Streptomyces griseus]